MSSSGCRQAGSRAVSADLTLRLSLPSSAPSLHAGESSTRPATPRNQVAPTQPVHVHTRALNASASRQAALFVKVHMEGSSFGRKVDLLLLDGYGSLLDILQHMFETSIAHADAMDHYQRVPREKADHVLTYEDQDGDWLVAGDVPWELFLASVTKLRIAKADKY